MHAGMCVALYRIRHNASARTVLDKGRRPNVNSKNAHQNFQHGLTRARELSKLAGRDARRDGIGLICKDTEGGRVKQKFGNKQNDIRDDISETRVIVEQRLFHWWLSKYK